MRASTEHFPVSSAFLHLIKQVIQRFKTSRREIVKRMDRYKSRIASPGGINLDRLGSSRIVKKIETFTHLKVKIPVKNGPN